MAHPSARQLLSSPFAKRSAYEGERALGSSHRRTSPQPRPVSWNGSRPCATLYAGAAGGLEGIHLEDGLVRRSTVGGCNCFADVVAR